MKIPKKFQVKGHDWRVEYRYNLHDPILGYCNGICDYPTRTILLDRLLPAQDKFRIFLHELTHATLYEAHLHEDGGVDGFAEEVICSSVADVFNKLFLFQVRPKR